MKFIVLIFIGMATALYSQDPYNIRLANELSQAHGKIIHELKDSYLCLGKGFNVETSVGEGIFATEIDKNTGKILHSTMFEIAGQTLSFNNINNGVEIDNDFFFIGHLGLNFLLLKYSPSVKEILLVKTLSPQIKTLGTFQYDFHYKDGEFYIMSPVEIGSTFKNSLLIIKYDLVNDTQSEILIDDENIDPSWGRMKILPSDNILITYSTDEDFRRLYVQEVDQEGIEIWNIGYPVSLNGSSRALLEMKINQFLIGGFNARLPSNSEPTLVPAIFKFDITQQKFTATSKFDLKTQDYNTKNSAVREITLSHDSIHYLCVANLYNTNHDPDTIIGKGMVAKVDTNLNTLWRRSYSILDSNFVGHTIDDIIQTSDGNYLCYGKALYYTIPIGEVPILSWVFKIDEDGKIVGDTTTAVVDWEDPSVSNEIVIFPNPATNQIYINQNDISDVVYKVYGLNGSLIEKFTLSNKNLSVVKSIEKWNLGYNIIQIEQDGKPIGSMKVLRM